MKLFRITSICIPFFLVLFLAGCFGPRTKQIKVNYYTLEYAPPEIKNLPKLPFSIAMDRFQISPEYDTDRFIFRQKDFQRNHYNYEKWRANPNDLVTYFLNRDLQRSNLFQGVFPPESLYKTSHLVTGALDAFYEEDGEPWKAVLEISLILMKQDEPDITKRILFQKTYVTKSPCDDKSPRSFVRAMSQAMALLSTDIIADLHRTLSENQQTKEGL